jgi:hypothetical protein
LAALFTAGAIVTAFTLGRAQAQSRVKWVATARALGANRSHLLGVAGLEWAVVGGAGASAGIALGWIAATWAHVHRMASLAAAPPVGVSFPMLVGGLLLALAALLAAAIVAVPSVIALRVSPTAALKPSAGADAMQLSRQVGFWPVPVLFALLWIATAALNYNTSWYMPALNSIATLATLVAGVAVLVESCRALVRATAHRLARSRRPWAVHASMTMNGHPQHVSALAIVQALLMTGIGGFIASFDTSGIAFGWTADVPWSSQLSLDDPSADLIRQAIPSPLTVPAVIALLVAIQLLVIAIAASARRVSWSESSTAGALGLTGKAAARGDAVAWWVAQAQGTWVGMCAGVVGVGGISLAAWASSTSTADPLAFLPLRVGGAVGVAIASLLIAAPIAGLAGALLRPRVPGTAARAAN